MPAKDGIVTRGGVNTKEINPKTMESRLIKGLFFSWRGNRYRREDRRVQHAGSVFYGMGLWR